MVHLLQILRDMAVDPTKGMLADHQKNKENYSHPSSHQGSGMKIRNPGHRECCLSVNSFGVKRYSGHIKNALFGDRLSRGGFSNEPNNLGRQPSKKLTRPESASTVRSGIA